MRFLSHFLFVLLFCILAFYIMRLDIPYEGVPPHDPGIFQYVAWRMAEGEILYVDLWDHKGALFHMVNAVGYKFAGSLWGVWLLQCALIVLSCIGLRQAVKQWDAL